MTLKDWFLGSKDKANNISTEEKPVTEQETPQQPEMSKEQKLDDWLREYNSLKAIVEKSKKDWVGTSLSISRMISETLPWLELGVSFSTLSELELSEHDRDNIESYGHDLIHSCISKYNQIKTIPEKIEEKEAIMRQCDDNIKESEKKLDDLSRAKHEIENLYYSCGEGEKFISKLEENDVRPQFMYLSDFSDIYDIVNYSMRNYNVFTKKLSQFEDLVKTGKYAQFLESSEKAAVQDDVKPESSGNKIEKAEVRSL